LIDDATDQIVGAHLLGHNADELINLFTIAIQSGIRLRIEEDDLCISDARFKRAVHVVVVLCGK
jgi:pyruvate/2-oxoglutarate dehydrogenase complex dihydrolipoamide dehydrogenase (E3) component